MSTEKANIAYEAVQELQEFESDFLKCVECFHEITGFQDDDDWPEVMVHMIIRNTDGISDNTYTYPAIRAGRELGLEVFDTVSYHEDRRDRKAQDVKIRFYVP